MISRPFKFRYLATFVNECILFQERMASHKQGDSGIKLRSVKAIDGKFENNGCNHDEDMQEIGKV